MSRYSAVRAAAAIAAATSGAISGFIDREGVARHPRNLPACELLESRQLLSVNVTTYHYDNARDGANTNETVLTPGNVNSNTFGKVASFPVDAQVYAQPLVMTNIAVAGQGTHDIVLVATENDSVYAFDAEGNNPAQGYLWKTSLLQTGETAVPQTDYATKDITPLIGITGTPVVDPSTNTLYVVGSFKESNATYQQRLYALDITSGAVKLGGPATIAASVPGSGYNNVNGTISFSAYWENQRPALTLANGNIYIAWSAHGDLNPWHGWVIAYSASTLQQDYVYCDTPNGDAGGIWMSGGGIAVDSSGNLYFSTGNGDFNASAGNFAMSIEKLSPSLSVEDYFTPYNQAELSDQDLDYGCSAVILLPTQSDPAAPNEILTESKWGTMYLNSGDTGSLGEFNTSTNDELSEVSIGSTMHNTISYWNGNAYVGGDGLPLEAYSVGGGTLGQSDSSQSSNVFGSAASGNGQGTGATVSSNGKINGIVWAVDNSGYNNSSATVYAYNANNLSQMLWNSNQAAGGRDTAGNAVKFQTAVVANGYVYVGGNGSVTVYGLLHSSIAPPTIVTPASASPSTVSGTTTSLTVQATDPSGDPGPVYTWTVANMPAGATTPTFSNSTSTTPTVTFYTAGAYTLTATIEDTYSGWSPTSSVIVTVNQTFTSVTVKPASAYVSDASSQQFTATGFDQFGHALTSQPTFNWAMNPGGAGGAVNVNTGLYSAPYSGTGTDTVTATSGALSASASVTVVLPSATVPVNLSNCSNTIGIVKDGVSFVGGLDGTSALSGNLLGTSQTWNGSNFTIAATTPTNNTANVVKDTGQTIALYQNKYSTLKILATHIGGGVSGLSFTINYMDGTTQTITQGFSDWYTPQSYPGESIAVYMPYRDNSNGSTDSRYFHLYGYSFSLNSSRTIKSITLPSDNNLFIVSMDLVGVTLPTWVGTGSGASWNSSTKVLTVTGATSIIADPGTDEPIIQANGSAAVVTINPASNLQIHIGGLNLSSGASAIVTSLGAARTTTNHRVLVLGLPGATTAPVFVVDATSSLDLADNDLVDHDGNFTAINNLLRSGFNAGLGYWNGKGIISSKAAAATLNTLGETQPIAAGTFDSESVGTSDVEVRYTYFGDANLIGYVDGSDYSKIDNGFLNHLTGFNNGDFNYDGVVNGSDYTLIDSAFNSQAGSLDSHTASAADLIAGASKVPAKVPTSSLANPGALWHGNDGPSSDQSPNLAYGNTFSDDLLLLATGPQTYPEYDEMVTSDGSTFDKTLLASASSQNPGKN